MPSFREMISQLDEKIWLDQKVMLESQQPPGQAENWRGMLLWSKSLDKTVSGLNVALRYGYEL